MGRVSTVSVATLCTLDGLGIESPRGRDVPHSSKSALVLTQLPVQLVPGILKRPGRGFDHPPRSSVVAKERVELYRYFQPEPSWHVPGCGSCSVVDT